MMLALLVLTASTGCERRSAEDSQVPAPMSESQAPTNRVDIGSAVRQNLGITFARVESRDVARTLRLPGRFELLPSARREYRVPAAGQVEVLAAQYESVTRGTPLFEIDSPRWREIQRELTDAHAASVLAKAAADSMGPFMEAHEKHHQEIRKAVDLWTQRVSELESLHAAGGASGEDVAQAKASLASVRSEFAETMEKEAELTARGSEVAAQLEAARARLDILIRLAASLTGEEAAWLLDETQEGPRWRTLDRIIVRASGAAVVDAIHIASGAFVDDHAPVLDTVHPSEIRFRASALQSDLGRLAESSPATVVAPLGGSLAAAAPVAGTLVLAPTADPERRTIEVVMVLARDRPLPDWARAGISAFLEVVTDGGSTPQLAIPLACVARDGTASIIFRRDPADPDKAIRMEADLGADDGRWIVIRSGVGEGNEIVLDGVYQLMVATSGTITKGGHFHPDGTFHEGSD